MSNSINQSKSINQSLDNEILAWFIISNIENIAPRSDNMQNTLQIIDETTFRYEIDANLQVKDWQCQSNAKNLKNYRKR